MYPFLFVILAVALFTDLKEDRVPNLLILSAILTGMTYLILFSDSWIFTVTDSLLVLICLIPIYMIGGLGGGDVKLLSVFPLFIGLESSVNSIITVFIVGAFCSVIKFIYVIKRDGELPSERVSLHFTVPIFIGTLISTLGGVKWITI